MPLPFISNKPYHDSQAGVLRGLGRSDEAEVPARRALAIRENAFGTESKEAAFAYHCLAEVLTDMERYRAH